MKCFCKTLVLLMFPLMLLSIIGCRENTILVFCPKYNYTNNRSLDMTRVCEAYNFAVREVCDENSNKEPFKDIKIQLKILPDKIYRDITKKGVTVLKKLLKENDATIAIYSEIVQPENDIPYCYCIIHLYLDNGGFTSHQSKEVMMDYETFYVPEFWKSEFRGIFHKLVGVL